MIDIRQVPFTHSDAVLLVEQVQAEYVVRYGSPDETPIVASVFDPPSGAFFVGYRDDEPVAMGGWRRRPDVQALMGKVAIEGDGSTCSVEPAFSVADRVTIETGDGRIIDSGDIRFARGHARRPLQPDDLKAKFLDCCRGAELDAGPLYEMLAALERVPDVAGLALH